MFDILMASLLVLYFVPTADAYDRAHPGIVSIALLNIFFGWTMIGWVVAFVWAQNISPVEFYVARNSVPA
jgi:hypothetical protein